MLLNEIVDITLEGVSNFSPSDFHSYQGISNFPDDTSPQIGIVDGNPDIKDSSWEVMAGGDIEGNQEDGYSIYVQYYQDDQGEKLGNEWAIKEWSKDTKKSDVIKVANIFLNGLKGKDFNDGMKFLKTAQVDHINTE